MQKLISYFFSGFNLKFQTQWFKNFLYGFVIVKCLYWLCFYDLLFGANSMIYTKPYPIGHFYDLPFLLYGQSSTGLGYFFIIPVLVLCLINLAWPRLYLIGDLIIWFLMLNLHNRIYSALSSGDYLLNQLLFFNCCLATTYHSTNERAQTTKTFLHNLGILFILVQINLLYALSAWAKLNNGSWLSGQAVPMISKVQHYNLFSFRLPEVLLVILNYLVLIYQCSFPFLIWLKPLKKTFILIGILMHLYIAFVMGLTGFGLVMILCYIFFWPFEKAENPPVILKP